MYYSRVNKTLPRWLPRILLLLAVAFFVVHALAESPSEASEKQIRRLREEIARLQQEIERAGSSEMNLQKSLSDLNRKIELKKQLQRELDLVLTRYQQQLKAKETRVREVAEQLDVTDSRSRTIQKRLIRIHELALIQVLQRYKYQRKPVWVYFLSGKSIAEAFQRVRLYAFLQRSEKRVTAELQSEVSLYRSTQMELSELHGRYSTEASLSRNRLKRTRQLQIEATEQQQRLQSELSKQRSMLAQVQNEKVALQRNLEERQASLSEIRRIIERDIAARVHQEEENRKRSEQNAQNRQGQSPAERKTVRGVATKGSLDWPVNGTVVTRFGWQQSGSYGTTIESPGIEVKAAIGTPVHAAADGVVTQVTWLRGFSTTVILEHGNGTYTVYAHLGIAKVVTGTEVKRGDILGTVGEVSKDTPPTVHFEVWNQRKKQDPMDWLERR